MNEAIKVGCGKIYVGCFWLGVRPWVSWTDEDVFCGLRAGETPGESVLSCAGADNENADGHENQKRNAESRRWRPLL